MASVCNATPEQYQKLICVFGDSPFRKSLLDVAYLNYPKGLQVIMLSHFTLDARNKFFNATPEERMRTTKRFQEAETIVYKRKNAEGIEHTQHSASSAECPVVPQSPSAAECASQSPPRLLGHWAASGGAKVSF